MSNVLELKVCEKTEVNVAARYPSMESLKAFFNYSLRESHPSLDEKFVMGSALAAKVLVRIVPAEVFMEQKSWIAFWLIAQRKGSSCLSEALKGSGMVTWGIRRQVKYLGWHKESDDNNDVYVAQNSSSSFVNGVEESQMGLLATCDDGEFREDGQKLEDGDCGERGEDMENCDDQENAQDEEEDEEEEEEAEEEEEEKIKVEEINENMNRKRYSFRNLSIRKTKKPKLEIRKQKQNQMQKKNQVKKIKGSKKSRGSLIQRDPKDRWSTQRYKLAEQNLLEVMKSKGATAEKPVLRPQLRAEARKRIGDTGLLDHLLKHMAGKLAPGGQERFRRRHNPDGAMEYWLECANLVNIRRDAGVTDPYWVPPPGWKLGDSPTQDPICARELKLLRGDVSKIKRSLELMATKMQLEEEVGKLRREIGEICYKKKQQENQSFTEESNTYDISQKLDQLTASFESLKQNFSCVHLSEEKYREQLMTISDFVKDIEGKFEKLAPNVTETEKTGSSLMIMGMREKTALENKEEQVHDALSAGGEGKKLQIEEKAAKIERLKSGFRICKPQGTFLWPNNNSSSSFVKVQVEVPTPPSVSSSTVPPQLPYHYQPPPPPSPSIVKPLAEKRAVKVTISNSPASVNLSHYKVSANRPALESGGGYTETATSCSEAGSWLALSTTLKSASDDSSHG
ncbi:protein DYAD-like [Salvia splendens]|uniref:protein DYAD-like n=1 Tax=Salvia splendens TaxID=180675 RepID=UPI001C26397B|nr:protein DYAD-like [Salvia splendens]